jgi:hypothetical protein
MRTQGFSSPGNKEHEDTQRNKEHSKNSKREREEVNKLIKVKEDRIHKVGPITSNIHDMM